MLNSNEYDKFGQRQKLGTELYDVEILHSTGYLVGLRPITTSQFRFGATLYSTIIIEVWGSTQRKIKAAYQFFFLYLMIL